MASFEHAVSLGYRYLETDAHRTADGVLVSFHDDDLNRTCGIDARIGEMTASEVAGARVRASDGAEYPIPLMADLFEAFPDARFNIDAKSDAAVEPLCELVRATRSLHRVCLASFSLRRIRLMRSIRGDGLMTNMSPVEIAGVKVLGRVQGDLQRSAQVPPRRGRVEVVDEHFLRRCRRIGIPVHVWTINDRPEMERLLDLGVDGIMTDETELLRNVFRERALWPT